MFMGSRIYQNLSDATKTVLFIFCRSQTYVDLVSHYLLMLINVINNPSGGTGAYDFYCMLKSFLTGEVKP